MFNFLSKRNEQISSFLRMYIRLALGEEGGSGSDALILGPSKNGLKASNFWRYFPMKSCSVCDFLTSNNTTNKKIYNDRCFFFKPNHVG